MLQWPLIPLPPSPPLPDVKLMELTDSDMANRAKVLLEEGQRHRRRQYEANKTHWQPAWFEVKSDPAFPARQVHQYKVWRWREGRANPRSPLTLPSPTPSLGRLLGGQGGQGL